MCKFNFDIMTANNYRHALASTPSCYHKARRGGNKVLNEYLERNNYNNDSLLACCYVSRGNNNKLNNSIMATKNLMASGLGVNVLRGVRLGMFDSFCVSLCNSLASSASASCGVGRITYAALVATWRKDTANSAYVLNETEGRKLYAANPEDSRVRRVGVEGHWSFFVAPSARDSDKETDSITVAVGGWLRSWAGGYESVVRYGHYGNEGVPADSCISAGLLDRCRALWSFRGVGGRTAASSEEKAQKKVAKAVECLSRT